MSRVRQQPVTSLLVPEAVLRDILALIALHDDPATETGGIILGHDHGSKLQVTAVGGPGPNAVHQPTVFVRDVAHANELALEAWRTDRSQWIGEWHTHPSGGPVPSGLDLQTYTELLHTPSLRLDRFLAVIVATSTPVSLAGWIVDRGSATAIPLVSN